MFTATSDLESLHDVLERIPDPSTGSGEKVAGFRAGISSARLFVLDECAYLSGSFKNSA